MNPPAPPPKPQQQRSPTILSGANAIQQLIQNDRLRSLSLFKEELDAVKTVYEQKLAEKDAEILSLQRDISQRDLDISEQQRQIVDRDAMMQAQREEILKRDVQIKELQDISTTRELLLEGLRKEIQMLQSQAMLQCPRCSVPQADKTPNQETGWDAATFGDFGLGGHGLERCDTDSSADVTMTCVDDQTLRSFSPFPEIQFDSILDSEPPLQMEVAIAAFGSLQIPDSPPRPFANALHGEHHPRAPSSSTSDDQQSSSDAEEEVEAQEVLAKLEANDNDEVPLPMAASETEDESRSSTSPAHTVTAYKSSSFPYQHIMHNDSYPSVPYFPWPTARRNIKKLLTGRAEYGNDVPMAGNKHLEVFTE